MDDRGSATTTLGRRLVVEGRQKRRAFVRRSQSVALQQSMFTIEVFEALPTSRIASTRVDPSRESAEAHLETATVTRRPGLRTTPACTNMREQSDS
jgi:hypothetical protein